MALVIDVLYVTIIALTIVFFVKKGFVDTAFRLGRLIGAAIISYFIGSEVGAFFYRKFLYGWVYSGVHSRVSNGLFSASESMNVDGVVDSLPIFVRSVLKADVIKDKYGMTGGNLPALAEDISVSVAKPFATFLSDVLGYLFVFGVAFLLILLLFLIMKAVFKLPVLNAINKIFGFLVGGLGALLAVLIFTGIIGWIAGLLGTENAFRTAVEASFFFGLLR